MAFWTPKPCAHPSQVKLHRSPFQGSIDGGSAGPPLIYPRLLRTQGEVALYLASARQGYARRVGGIIYTIDLNARIGWLTGTRLCRSPSRLVDDARFGSRPDGGLRAGPPLMMCTMSTPWHDHYPSRTFPCTDIRMISFCGGSGICGAISGLMMLSTPPSRKRSTRRCSHATSASPPRPG